MFVKCSLFFFMFLVKFGSLDEYDYDPNSYDWYKDDEITLPTEVRPATPTTSTTTNRPPTTADDYYIPHTYPWVPRESPRLRERPTEMPSYYPTTRPRYDTTTKENTGLTLRDNGAHLTTAVIVIVIQSVMLIFFIICIIAVVIIKYGKKESLDALWESTVATITCRNNTDRNEQSVKINNEKEIPNEQAVLPDEAVIEIKNDETAHRNEETVKSSKEINNETLHANEQASEPSEATSEMNSETSHQNEQATKSCEVSIEMNN